MKHLAEWFKLTHENQKNIFNETGNLRGLPGTAIEKDWWVVHTLGMVFSLEYADSLIFKGGTSLSKGWDLINRLSEDIDLVLDPKLLGIDDPKNKKQVHKLRTASNTFVSTTFTDKLRHAFKVNGFENIEITCDPKVSDEDPVQVLVKYMTLTESVAYLPPPVKIEIGSRSLIEPFVFRPVRSFVAEQYATQSWADSAMQIPIVKPERTFWEKVLLLYETYQNPKFKLDGTNRLSRHLYDIEMLEHSEYAAKAMADRELFEAIVAHRRVVNAITGVDYDKHKPQHINFIPPDDKIADWEKDYKALRESMIYGESLEFNKLIEKLRLLQNKIQGLTWK